MNEIFFFQFLILQFNFAFNFKCSSNTRPTPLHKHSGVQNLQIFFDILKKNFYCTLPCFTRISALICCFNKKIKRINIDTSFVSYKHTYTYSIYCTLYVYSSTFSFLSAKI